MNQIRVGGSFGETKCCVADPDDQCPRVVDQIDDTWGSSRTNWLLHPLQFPVKRPVVAFSCSLHRIAHVRDVISIRESSLVVRISSESSLRSSQSLGCITFAQTETDATLPGWTDLRRGSVLTLGAKQTASHASARLNQLHPLLCTLLSSVLLIQTSSKPFLPPPPGRSQPFPCIAGPRVISNGCIFDGSLSFANYYMKGGNSN